MVKVAIGAGHGGFGVTPGKRTPDGEYEWDFNNKVVESAIRHLNKYKGVQVKRLDDPTGKTDVSLTARTNAANTWGADILISCHHNAFTGKWGNHTGTETYTYNGGSYPKAEKLAKIVQKHVVKAYGLSNRGLKKANFHMLRESKMPAILVEGGYMDSTIDIKKLRDDNVLNNVGKEIAKAVAEYFGLAKEHKPSKPTSKPPKPSKSSNILQPGDRGTAVRQMQKDLASVYFYPDKGAKNNGIDGIYGPKTKDAVRRFQSMHGLAQDGIFGPKTRAALNKAMGKKSKPKKSKSISQMAREIIAGKHGNGNEARRKSLGISKAEYEKVRAEVNKRL